MPLQPPLRGATVRLHTASNDQQIRYEEAYQAVQHMVSRRPHTELRNFALLQGKTHSFTSTWPSDHHRLSDTLLGLAHN